MTFDLQNQEVHPFTMLNMSAKFEEDTVWQRLSLYSIQSVIDAWTELEHPT